MKIYTYREKLNTLHCEEYGIDTGKTIFFDIETTGLSAKNSYIYMIGYGITDNSGNAEITLLFNDDGTPVSEKEMLIYFADISEHFSHTLTYNGNTFDIPYVRERLKQHDLADIFESMTSIDLFVLIRKYKAKLHLNSCHQSDIEELCGIHRNDFCSGGKLIGVYKKYLKTKDNADLDDLLKHNHDDILGLMSITDMAALNYTFSGNYTITSASIDNDGNLTVTCSTAYIPTRITYSNGDMFVNLYENTMTLRFKPVSDTMKYYFRDYKNYYYMPLENKVIHKSLARYVEPEFIEKATKENAYTVKQGFFLTQAKTRLGYEYRYNLDDKQTFMDIDGFEKAAPQDKSLYIKERLNEKYKE